MHPILDWGLGVVRWVQGASSPLATALAQGLSFSATEYFLLAVLPLVYWCVDKRRGLRIATLVFLSTAVNLRLKLAFAQPRPYDLDPSVGLAREETFGLPSDHSQTAVVLWGTAARLFKPPLGLALALAMPLLVGLSRVYLGVHFPTDVLAGWAVGAAFVALERIVGDKVERAIAGLRESLAIALVAAVALAMNLLTDNAHANLSGAFFGLAGAAVYARRSAPFSVSGGLGKRALRYLLGMATVAVVYVLPKLALASVEAEGPPIWRFARYALLGAWIAAGAPWLFLKIGLASAEGPAGGGAAPYSASEKDESVSSK